MPDIEVAGLVTRLAIDDTDLEKSMAELNRQMKLVKSEFQKASSGLTEFATSSVGLKTKSDALTKQLEVQAARVAKLHQQHTKAAEEKGKDDKATQNLEVRLNKAVAEYNKLDAELQKTNAQLTTQTSKWHEVSKSLDLAGTQLQSVGKKMETAGKALTLGVTAPILAIGGLAVKASVEFESAFAGVRKTVDATDEELEKLEQGIRDMSQEIPVAAKEIAKVAEAAGQLGIKVPNIMGFTRVMSDLGVSTNMSADSAATALARLANITQMPQTEFDKLGSTVVALGNNLATTESEIVEMGLRIAGAGKQVGMSEAQILSFAGALSSVGMEAQAGGTSISKLVVDMQLAVEKGGDSLNEFASVAGMSAQQFQTAFRDDATGAITAFIKGLGTAEQRGISAIKVLDDMGISEVRTRDSLLRLAGAGNLLTNSLQIGTEAWEENIALTKEAAERNKTTESQMIMLKNRINEQAIVLGDQLAPALLDALDAAEPFFKAIENGTAWFADLDTETQRAILTFVGLVAALGPVLSVSGKIATVVGGMAKTYSKVTAAMAAKTAATATMTVATTTATASTTALGTAMTFLLGPIGLAVAAVGALTLAIVGYNRSAAKAFEERTKAIADEMYKAAEEEKAIHLQNLADREQAENEAYEARRSQLDEEYRAVLDTAQKMHQAEQDRIQKRLSSLEGEHRAAIQSIRDEYGVVESVTRSRTDLAREASKAVIDSLDNEAQKARDVHAERMRQIDEEYAGKLTLLDEETRAELEAIQEQINGIDNKTKAEDKAEQERKDAVRTAQLQARIEEEEDATKRAELQQELQEHLSAIERKHLLERRDQQKQTLRDQMDAVRDAAEKRKEELKAEYEAQKTAEGELLAAQLADIEELKLAEEQALVIKIAQIQDERIQKEQAEIAKHKAAEKSLEEELKALDLAYITKQEAMAKEYQDKLTHETAMLKAYEKRLLDERTALDAHYVKVNDKIEEQARIIAQAQIKTSQDALTNMLSGGIPSYGGEAPIGNNAAGTDSWRGGWTWVGEKGPELMNLPRGTKILNNHESEQMVRGASSGSASAGLASAGTTIKVDVHNNVFQDGRDAGDQIVNAMRRAGIRW